MDCSIILKTNIGKRCFQILPSVCIKYLLPLPWLQKALLDKRRLQPTDRHFENELQAPLPVPALGLRSAFPAGPGDAPAACTCV